MADTRTRRPEMERISVFIDDVDIPNRIVHARDRSGGRIQATFHDIDDYLPIPYPLEFWIAERSSWDSWRLRCRVSDREDTEVLKQLEPGDRIICAPKGNLWLKGNRVLLDNDPVDNLEVVNKGYVDDVIVSVSSGGPWSVTSVKIANYTADFLTDNMIPIDSSGGSFDLSLPTGVGSGRRIRVKDVGFACSTNPVTIKTVGAELIDGDSTYVINGDGESFIFWSDGSDFYVS